MQLIASGSIKMIKLLNLPWYNHSNEATILLTLHIVKSKYSRVFANILDFLYTCITYIDRNFISVI